MAEVQGVLESRKFITEETSNGTYIASCNRDTFERLQARGVDPYGAPIWSIYFMDSSTTGITEKKQPYDSTNKKFLKQGKLIWNNRNTYTYL